MSPKLQEVFGELGISQYLDVFLDQGFDTWETILDITESDLDALGVKLGHRRKLQRRIANARGVAPDVALASPTRASVEDTRAGAEVQKPEASAVPSTDSRENSNGVVQKRKYRRHPKPDENAPERAPSAYVLFSNKMREDLKGQNLTFTEIAKLVGENWQGLTQAEKEPYERDAQAAKEKYNRDLAEYKKTPDYKKYLQYLQEFKAKHANHPQDKEVSKRVRLSDPSIGDSTAINGHSARAARAGSVGDHNGEPPARRQRIGSIVSNGESYYAPSVASISQRTPGEESILTSPAASYFDRRFDRRLEQSPGPGHTGSPRDISSQPSAPPRRDPVYTDGPRADGPALARSLPPLSDVFEGRSMLNGAAHPSEAPAQSMGLLPRGLQTASPANTPSLSGSESRPPSLKKEQSSAGSMSSASSAYSSFPRTPIEGPLPIHALLSGGKQFSYDTAFAANPAIQGRSMSPDDRPPAIYPLERAPSDPTPANHALPHINGYLKGHGPVPSQNHTPVGRHAYSPAYNESRLAPVSTPVPAPAPATGPAPRLNGKSEPGMDGISALLQADKIVDRRSG